MGVLKTVNLKGLGEKHSGKVRDYYILDGPPSLKQSLRLRLKASARQSKRVLITTDRISAFDVILGYIPYKGAVLNLLSSFWFDKLKKIVDNHLIFVPDPNVTIARNANPIPIEMVVRGYITGVTGTSIWGSYERGERIIYGIKFPSGLRKNQKLPNLVITPTTKAEVGHDERLTEKEILGRRIVTPKLWKQMKQAALALFEKGTKICERSGIILVDTKYEFGLDKKGNLLLIDEIHTPDSSRFWVKESYKKKFSSGEEPENFDKEFLRIWYVRHGYKGEGQPPKMPTSLQKAVSKRYITIYEKITGKKFKKFNYPIEKRIRKNLLKFANGL